MKLSNRKQIVIEDVNERRTLINLIKQSGLEVAIYSEDDFDNERFKMPFNNYIHICYSRLLVDETNPLNFGDATIVKLISGNNFNVTYHYSLLDDSYYEVNDEIRNGSNRSLLAQTSRELRRILKAAEKKFGFQVSVSKLESRQWMPEIETPHPFKNLDYDGTTTANVYGYDLNSAYSAYIKKYGLDWCCVPSVDYKGQEAQINAYINKSMCNFIDKWFKIKQTAQPGSTVKAEAKLRLNTITGFIRNMNPQAYKELKWGVQTKMINPLMQKAEQDGNPVIYSNIDSIYTVGECAALNQLLGNDIGQFKLEHCNCNFTWELGKLNYQINEEPPVSRGVPKVRYAQFFKQHGRAFKLNKDVLTPTHYYTCWDLTN